MDPVNNSFDVFEKIEESDRKNWHLIIDAVYKADPSITNISAEVLSKLLGVKNQGGFRYLGKTETPNLVVLFTSGEDVYWKDELNTTTGLLLYYSDNKTPGNDLHKNVVYLDFYLQAKCYNPDSTAVVVKDTSRLISRIKDRQFGVMFTTSYVATQAYQEIIEDGHPIVIINGRNIIEYIYDELEIRSVERLEEWLKLNYSAVSKKKSVQYVQNNSLGFMVADKTPKYGN